MHYKNGREVKIGDFAVKRNTDGSITAGLVSSLNPGSSACNLGLATFSSYVLSPGQTNYIQPGSNVSIDADGKAHLITSNITSGCGGWVSGEFLHVDDALKAFEKLEAQLP